MVLFANIEEIIEIVHYQMNMNLLVSLASCGYIVIKRKRELSKNSRITKIFIDKPK